ncbi:MAG TPA: nucleotide exchange factor GrpE [Candidatus Flavonifractor merdigallinarum]|uniref:Protein GrpE n=1 Tax=Candidatus Flavonifractor merdigallinarum TaxID=2838589 RepID=A0A9D2BXW6_9FIRM|nr:nucleotide exchange factor GrpE [Candidatus Flavonifractor merdigallinarum]
MRNKQEGNSLSKQKEKAAPQPDAEETVAPETQPEETAAPQEETPDPLLAELEALKDSLAKKEEQYLRLAAEYDNYRKRTQKEKTDAYQSAKADAVLAFLPVYDNLERALKQETADEAYKKGVEMTMTGLKEVLGKLGVEEIPALGETFDPSVHNAVMHVEDEGAGENTVVEVFQAGFRTGEKVIRFAMVKVAN